MKFDKIFSVVKEGAHLRINILGLKISFLNLKRMNLLIHDMRKELNKQDENNKKLNTELNSKIQNLQKKLEQKDEELNSALQEIELSLKNKQKMINDINIALAWPIRGKIFLYSNLDKFSTDDKIWFLSQAFYKGTGYFPNLKNPKSFNEKINWMKLNYNNPNEVRCIDKYEFKNHIKEQLGSGYTVPLIAGPYKDVNDIVFESLPDKFVIKLTTYGAGMGIEIVKDKNKINVDKIKCKFNNLLRKWNSCYYSIYANGYKNIKPRIIIEEYVEELEKTDCDYKFFCFHGKVKCFYIANNWAVNLSHDEKSATYYDLRGNPLPFVYGDYKRTDNKLDNIANFDEMVRISEILSKDFPFVRVDFFNLDNKLMLSEMTFTPGGAFGKYNPVEWDYKIGEWLDLSKLNPEYLHIEPEFAQAAKTFIAPKIVNAHTVGKELTKC